jgi:23S rRNA (guanosine2251-2'-O)-methyltransferase
MSGKPKRQAAGKRSQGQRSQGQRSQGQRGTTPTRKSGGGPKGLGGDQVEGRHAVRELLLARRRKTREIFLAEEMDEAPILDDIIDLADEAKVSISEISRGKFESLARTEAPQGVVAMAAPLEPVTIEAVAGPESGQVPFLLVVDSVTDPGNLGTLLRTAECAGVNGVLLPKHRAARISPTVTKAAAGAIEHLPMVQVSGIPAALEQLKRLGVWTVGLDVTADTLLYDIKVAEEPIALVLGAEGKGISRLVRERCDLTVTIPLGGSLGSLNVAAAGALACFEVARRRLG